MSKHASSITVLLVDDHPLFRRGVKDAIEEDADMTVIGEASDGEEALALYPKLRPSVVVADIDMPHRDGFSLATALLEQFPDVHLVFLTMHRDSQIFDRAMEIGVNAFVPKDEVVDEIVRAIRQAAQGLYHIPSSLSDLIVQRSRRKAQSNKSTIRYATLTPMERTILKAVAHNKTSKEIASELGISIRTVGTHRNNISRKLEIGGSMPLVNFALLHREDILSQEKFSELSD